MTSSQRARARKSDPKRSPSESYDTTSYRREVFYGCKVANVPQWHPNQLRHNAATLLRKELDIDITRAVLGHSPAATTEIYAEIDEAKARAAMERFG